MFKPKKSFGQNFLTDHNIAAKIVRSAEIKKGDEVWEIGSGKGVLTAELLKTGCILTCFEIDRDLVSLLEERFEKQIILLACDVLKADWSKLIAQTGNRIRKKPQLILVANIPYNITSPLLYRITEYADYFQKIVIMVQKEVAERITARPGNKSYGVMSLRVQYHFAVKKLFGVPSHLFRPQPAVDSTVIKIIPERKRPEFSDPQLFWKIIETAFQSRRKTLKNNLSRILSEQELQKLTELLAEKELYKTLLPASLSEKQLKFSLKNRGETLDEEDFISLYHLIWNIRNLDM